MHPMNPTARQRSPAVLVYAARRALILLAIACLALNACSPSDRDADAPLPPKSSAEVPSTLNKHTRPPEMPPGVVRLEGAPEEIGRQHGSRLTAQIRLMVGEYVGDDMESGRLKEDVLKRVRTMKPSLPDWYRQELSACAKAAGIDEDVLLYAQCEGDIKSLGGCNSFVAFGPATHDGKMEIGRNFDYWGIESTDKVVTVLAVVPRSEDGYAFVSVGWCGILGGWTFFNEKGLYVSNNLGGFYATDPRGVPTLILERIIAQKAATVDEAVAIIRKTPRMRGQALVIGQAGNGRSVAPGAVVVLYDGKRVEVTPAENGLAFHSSIGTDPQRLLRMLQRPNRRPMDVIKSAGNGITLHSVAIRPAEHALWVAHGRKPGAHLGEYVRYDLRSLLERRPK